MNNREKRLLLEEVYNTARSCNVPRRHIGLNKAQAIQKFRGGKSNDVASSLEFIYDHAKDWTDAGCTFVVESMPDNKKDIDKEQELGCAIVVNAILYDCGNPNALPGRVAQVINFSNFDVRSEDYQSSSVLFKSMTEPQYLFIHGVACNPGLPKWKKDKMATLLNSILSIRKDNERVTILSFDKTAIDAWKRSLDIHDEHDESHARFLLGRQVFETLDYARQHNSMVMKDNSFCHIQFN